MSHLLANQYWLDCTKIAVLMELSVSGHMLCWCELPQLHYHHCSQRIVSVWFRHVAHQDLHTVVPYPDPSVLCRCTFYFALSDTGDTGESKFPFEGRCERDK